MQSGLVVRFGEGVREQDPLLVGGCLGERLVPRPGVTRSLSMASGSQTPSSVMPYSTTIRFWIWAGSPPLVIAIARSASRQY